MSCVATVALGLVALLATACAGSPRHGAPRSAAALGGPAAAPGAERPIGGAALAAPAVAPTGPAVDGADDPAAELERSLRELMAAAADPTPLALELAGLLMDLERHPEALAALVGARQRLAAAGRSVDPVLQIAIAGVQRDLGQRHLAVAGLEALLADRGVLALHPALVLELAELQWLEGKPTAAVATLADLRRGHDGGDWFATNGGAVQRLEQEIGSRSTPSRMRLRDLFGNLRGATEAFVRLRTLEELVRLGEEQARVAATAERASPRAAAIGPKALAIAFGDTDGLVRARAVQLTGPTEDPMAFCRAALADADARVRAAAAAKAGAWLGREGRVLLVEALAREADPRAFRGCHEALLQVVGQGPRLEPGAEDVVEQRIAAVSAWRQQ